MTSSGPTIFYGTSYIKGVASANLLASKLELSFWGGVDPKTSEVIDRFHPLSGRYLKDTVLAIPGGRGSCTGSAVILELILNGLGPKALILERRDEILILGVIVAEEFFGKSIPVVVLESVDFRQVLERDGQFIHAQNDKVSALPLQANRIDRFMAPKIDLENLDVRLSDFDQKTLDGIHGEAAKISLKIIIRIANMMGARELMDISQAHVDGTYYGPGSVAFAERLRDCGGKFRVPTTINALNVDQRRWRTLGINPKFGTVSEQLTKVFTDMGGTKSFTCAPYLLDSAPKLGDPIAWGESNAVIYANSVLGARTLKNPNMLECLIALTGRAPKAGVYIDQNRFASIWIRVHPFEGADDSFWSILGYSVGVIAANRIPVITGLEATKPLKDDLKAFSAAFGTSSSAPMFHMVSVTPEARTLEAACAKGMVPDGIDLDWAALDACWNEFNHGSSPRQVDLISLGNPHFSFQEIKRLATLFRGRTKHKDVAIIVTSGRSQHGLAMQAGYIEELEQFGVQFLTDTCWCFIEEGVIPKRVCVIMTNSGKYVHYGPGLTGRQFCFGSLEMCVEVACAGRSSGDPPLWLQRLQSGLNSASSI